MTRRFEFTDAKSNKFWEITVAGKTVILQYGRLGTDGQRQSKSYATPSEAESAAEKQVAEKLRKGYRLAGEPAVVQDTKSRRRKAESKAVADSTLAGGNDRYAWNARTIQWRRALLVALEEGRTTLDDILPLYREDPAVIRAAAKGGWDSVALEEINFTTHALRLRQDEHIRPYDWFFAQLPAAVAASTLGTEDLPERVARGNPINDHSVLFTPSRWPGRSKTASLARKLSQSAEWKDEGNLEQAFRVVSDMPSTLRSDADFIGPLLLCHGLLALTVAAPEVQSDPDILRAVFTESLFDDQRESADSDMLRCLQACLVDRSTGLRGPATMAAGEHRTFQNEGRPIEVYCLARQEESGQKTGKVVVTSLLLFSPESDDELREDIAAIQVRSQIRGKGKKREWEVIDSTMRTPFSVFQSYDSKLDFFSLGDDDGDEFEFEDDEGADKAPEDTGKLERTPVLAPSTEQLGTVPITTEEGYAVHAVAALQNAGWVFNDLCVYLVSDSNFETKNVWPNSVVEAVEHLASSKSGTISMVHEEYGAATFVFAFNGGAPSAVLEDYFFSPPAGEEIDRVLQSLDGSSST